MEGFSFVESQRSNYPSGSLVFSTISSSLCMHFGGFSPFLCQHLIFHLYSSSLSMLFSSNRNIFTCKLIPSVLPHCKASPCRGSACLMEFRATGGKLQPSRVPAFHTVDQAGRPLPTGHGFFNKKRVGSFSCVRKCNNAVIICCRTVP